ncbi:MAG: hypothetical protein RMM58_08490 [Chloroflexota bacterium]|nr:hypothetical protein [Dehalococcoidia bacterium]MDW8253902.1 hypothetical protein [Chloroflexota bacterium]
MRSIARLRLEALSAFARLLRSFSDHGLGALERAARDARLVRGVWSAADAGCPLSCADGVLGRSGARRFFWQAHDRNRFVTAWDAGLVSAADVAALVQLERERRARAWQRRARIRSLARRLAERFSPAPSPPAHA